MIPLTWLVSSAPFVDEWLEFPEQDSKPSTFTSTLPSPTSALINSFEDTPTSSQWGGSLPWKILVSNPISTNQI